MVAVAIKEYSAFNALEVDFPHVVVNHASQLEVGVSEVFQPFATSYSNKGQTIGYGWGRRWGCFSFKKQFFFTFQNQTRNVFLALHI